MLEVIKLFVRRMLMGKGKGILKIPPQKNVDDFANDLFTRNLNKTACLMKRLQIQMT